MVKAHAARVRLGLNEACVSKVELGLVIAEPGLAWPMNTPYHNKPFVVSMTSKQHERRKIQYMPSKEHEKCSLSHSSTDLDQKDLSIHSTEDDSISAAYGQVAGVIVVANDLHKCKNKLQPTFQNSRSSKPSACYFLSIWVELAIGQLG